MAFEINNTKYTTLDRGATFTFDFAQITAGEWRIYIRDTPSYGSRPGGVSAHRLHDPRGDYICWVPAPTTLNEAKGVARAWADATWDYILTGAFPAPGPARDVPDLSSSANWPLRDHVGVIPNQPAPGHEPMRIDPSRPSGLRGLFSNRRNDR